MQIGDKRNTTRKAQIFWGLAALILALFFLVWFRHSANRDTVIVSSARPYLNLTRTGWVLTIICAIATTAVVLLLSFESSDMIFLALSGFWILSTIFLIVGEVMIIKKDHVCPAGQKCVGSHDKIFMCSFIVTAVSMIQCILVGIAFLQVRSLKREAVRLSRRSAEKGNVAGSTCLASKSTTSLRKFIKSKVLSRLWTAGIKPSSTFRDRP